MFIFCYNYIFFYFNFNYNSFFLLWGLGIGDWGLGNPQSPIPNPHINTLKLIRYSYK